MVETKLNPGSWWELAEQAGRTPGPGSFHAGEVPAAGAGVPSWPHPIPWPQGMWAQGGKWVRAGLELNIGLLTSQPAPKETQPKKPVPFSFKGSPILFLQKGRT